MACAELRARLGPALHVIERIEYADMAILYTTTAVLLFPSHYEGFGLPVLEAQVCGTPVVCADQCALMEVAVRRTLVTHDFRPADLAFRMRQALGDSVPGESSLSTTIFATGPVDSAIWSTWSAAHGTIYTSASDQSAGASGRTRIAARAQA